MTSANSSQTDDRFLANSMASFLQIGALLLLLMLKAELRIFLKHQQKCFHIS